MGFNGRKLAESIYSRNIINNRYFDLLQNLSKKMTKKDLKNYKFKKIIISGANGFTGEIFV